MAHLKLPLHIRLQLAAKESPTNFSGMHPGVGLSPVTDLALNLSGTSLGSTPRRRLSLSSIDNSPSVVRLETLQPDFSETDSPCIENRLLKNSIKLSYSNEGNVNRGRGFSRRLNVNLPASPLNYEKCNTPNNDKENMGFGGAGTPVGVIPEIDVHSFSHHSSPTKQINSPSKFAALRQNSNPLRQRQPLEDQDPNSQDSGYGTFLDKDDLKTGFRFVEPSGLAPRRSNSELSPRKENSPEKSPRSIPCGSPSLSFFHSLSSGSESIDDGFTDLLDVDKVEETTHLPSGISSLLSGPIIRDHNTIALSCSPKEEKPRPIFQRSISLVDNLTPASSRARNCLFKPSCSTQSNEEDSSQLVTLETLRSFKRPDPPCELGPLQPKRRKSSSLHSIRESTLTSNPGILQRSFSETEATIKRALQRSTQIPDLIGDFSKPFVLPLMEGRHQDLKTISADTLATLMNGHFSNEVETYTIVDCRYPYEYDGGHIRGARNIYTKEQIYKEFVDMKPSAQNSAVRDPSQKDEASASKRRILIFHCEFSSERGPSLFRFLRNSDRDQNKEFYPALNYPELYLLHGGYKSFFERHSDKCEPCAYRPMLDPNHETDLKHFRSKSKSWNGDSKSRLALRNNLKRLGL